jgi:hypothetical protein
MGLYFSHFLSQSTDHHDRAVKNPASYSGGPGFKSPPGDTENVPGFRWSLQANSGESALKLGQNRIFTNNNSLLYTRGGQLDQLREPNFRRQQSARAMFSTLKFIKSKYRSVLTDEQLADLL